MDRNNNDTLIGIVVTTYNRINNLRLLLKALSMQKMDNYRLVIMDDGSVDGTSEFISNLRKEEYWNERVYYRYQEHIYFRGAALRNFGCSLLPFECKLLIFMDSDIIFDSDFLQNCLNIYAKHPNCIQMPRVDWLPPIDYDTLYNHIDGDFLSLENCMENIRSPYQLDGTFIGKEIRLCLNDNPFTETNINNPIYINGDWTLLLLLIVPREIFLSVNGFDEDYIGYGYEDIDFGKVCESKNIMCFSSSNTKAFHVWHPKSNTIECKAQNQYNLHRLILKHGITKKLQLEVDYSYWWHYCYERGGKIYSINQKKYAFDLTENHCFLLNKSEEVRNLGFLNAEIMEASSSILDKVTVHEQCECDCYIPDFAIVKKASSKMIFFFDIGNVMLNYNPEYIYKGMKIKGFDNAKSFWSEIFSSDWNVEQETSQNIDRGIIELCDNYPQYKYYIQLFKTDWIFAFTPNEDLFKIIRRLWAMGFDMGIVSNMTAQQFCILHRKYYIFDCFDHIFVSGFLRERKPDDGFYISILDSISKDNRKLLFIDDNVENIKGAQKFGISAYLYRNVEKFTDFLKKYIESF